MIKNYWIALIALFGLSLFSTIAQIKFESEIIETVTIDTILVPIASETPDVVNSIVVNPTVFSVFYVIAFLALRSFRTINGFF